MVVAPIGSTTILFSILIHGLRNDVLALKGSQIQGNVSAVELTSCTAGSKPVNHIRNILNIQERNSCVHFLIILKVLSSQLINELYIALNVINLKAEDIYSEMD